MTLSVVSFGYGHGAPPSAHLTVDVRELFRDPHIDPVMRELTGRDEAVIDRVLSQPGAGRFVRDLADVVSGLSIVGDVFLAVGCVGGRHRSVVIADAVAARLVTHGYRRAAVVHRDVDKPVLRR